MTTHVANQEGSRAVEPDPRVEAACNGDRRAFDTLCDATTRRRWLVVIALLFPARLRSKLDPEDVLQETLQHAWRDLSGLRERTTAGFQQWVSGIARHVVADQLRRYRKLKRNPDREEGFQHDADSVAFRLSATPSRVIARRELTSKVVEHLDQLKPAYREVIVLRVLEGRSTKQVAELLNITPENVSVLLHRALSRFRTLVEESGIQTTLLRGK